ncbi:putative disease resistance protein At1g50180 [Magnolia sinica]|uniref:putative disease resistance protein At1g50180 n=1 Tax=Magnolia sinica TaxID=86752 RepID=UPI00265A5BE6|nr:putative disease resistance protein At1g50180 [Magnolia sinica]
MSAVESVVELVLGKLADSLIQKAIFLCGVRDQVELLMFEFEQMVAFLEDADSKQEGDRRVKRWVQHVRDVAYDAEDVIDKFMLKMPTSKPKNCLGRIKRYACIPVELKALHDVGSEIQRINNKIHRISESRSTYGIADISQGAGKSSADPIHEERRLTSLNSEESDFVGFFQKESEALVKKLTNESEQRRCLVSVVGMGGLGKTTLTKKVYNDPRVKAHFDSFAWISISQDYVVTDLLQKILNCYISKDKLKEVKEMDVNQLKHEISEHLKEKRYLVVLDDIWSKEAWNDLKGAFPETNNGSRVVLTTRKEDVALYAQSEVHRPGILNEEESWELFCKKTFPGHGGCPPELVDVGKKIVQKCHGLPLAVIVIGGLLTTTTKEAAEWKKVHESSSWHLVKGEINISGILSLSYKDLPYYLKPCFLYLGNFPEDYEFHAKTLIQMWAAEGFLEERGEETLEEVGEDYLMQLIQRIMVQVTERSSSRGIKRCRIHDLLRDLSISKAKEDMFLQVHSRINANAPPASRARRLAIHNDDLREYTSLKSFTPQLRSVLIYTQGSTWLQREEEKFLFRGFKLLRVLYIHSACIKKLPKEIGEL